MQLALELGLVREEVADSARALEGGEDGGRTELAGHRRCEEQLEASLQARVDLRRGLDRYREQLELDQISRNSADVGVLDPREAVEEEPPTVPAESGPNPIPALAAPL